jgi:hypothetical protein
MDAGQGRAFTEVVGQVGPQFPGGSGHLAPMPTTLCRRTSYSSSKL